MSYILIPVGTIMVNEPFFHLQWSSYDSFMTLENRARKDSTSACDSDAGISFWSQFDIQSKMFFIFISYFSEYFELIDTRHTVFAKQNKGISVDCPEQLIPETWMKSSKWLGGSVHIIVVSLLNPFSVLMHFTFCAFPRTSVKK